MLVNPLRADTWLTIDLEVAADVLWAPVLLYHLVDTLPRCLSNAAPIGAVSTQTGVSLQLAADRRWVNVKLRYNGILRQSRFLQRVEFDTVVPSDAVV